MRYLKSFSILAVVLATGIQQGFGQAWTTAYSSPTATGTCTGLTAALTTGFAVTPLISRALFPNTNPLRINKMAFWMNPTSGKTDIYLAEKGGGGTAGRVLYYNGTDNTLTAIGTIPNVNIGFQEYGVVGIALNAKTFAQDNFLYFMYNIGSGSAPASPTTGFRIVRYKVNSTTKMMDLASQKVLMHIPSGTNSGTNHPGGRWHQGGSMQFDNFGNLYITVGDNEALANGAANTADLRGAILRIHPDSTVPNGYTIPAGNFGEYWANQWQNQGLTARAAAYRDTSIVKPELYVKGTRNAYGSSTDKDRLGMIAWSQCGPDVQRAEGYYLTNHPGFGGWPFWAGNAVRQAAFANYYMEPNEPTTTAQWTTFNPTTMTTAVPVNNWAPATGVDTLPPMINPIYTEVNGCAQGGAIIRYDGRINNPNKMPPQLDNTVMYTNESSSSYYLAKFDPATGAAVGTATTVFTSLSKATTAPNLGSAVDLQQGPDGAIYSLNWGGGCCDGNRAASAYEGVARVTYTGTCQDTALFPSTTAISKIIYRGEVDWLKMGGKSFSVYASGPHEVRILDLQGRSVAMLKGDGPKDYVFPSTLSGNSLYYLQVKTEEGTAIRGFVYQ